ncbi:beta-ketoacyl [acyl carrier protein] synthase domain-containing protein, partial [Paenibacillus sp. TH7-28]
MERFKEEIISRLESGGITPEEAYSLFFEGGSLADPEDSGQDRRKVGDAGDGDIAIIGFACRFPGASDAEKLWILLKEGKCSVGEVPSGRWRMDEALSDEGMNPAGPYCRQGGFIEDIEGFAADFFGLSVEEAEAIDPQQRHLLETAYHTFEHAGYSREELWGSGTGVFVGCRAGNYHPDKPQKTDKAWIRAKLTGTIGNFNAARISDYFNLKGPSLVFDTACSSSLVSVHYACKALRDGECGMALAGGVELKVHADTFVSLNLAKALSPDGTCHVFDKRANGFVPGEGVGAVLLKPYRRALADGDTVYAVIKGSAVNNDGHTMGITTPDLEGQAAVIERALEEAGVH